MLTESERIMELEANVTLGNHNSVTSKLEELSENSFIDVKYSFTIPIISSILKLIPGMIVQLCGLSAQFLLAKINGRKGAEGLAVM